MEKPHHLYLLRNGCKMALKMFFYSVILWNICYAFHSFSSALILLLAWLLAGTAGIWEYAG